MTCLRWRCVTDGGDGIFGSACALKQNVGPGLPHVWGNEADRHYIASDILLRSYIDSRDDGSGSINSPRTPR